MPSRHAWRCGHWHRRSRNTKMRAARRLIHKITNRRMTWACVQRWATRHERFPTEVSCFSRPPHRAIPSKLAPVRKSCHCCRHPWRFATHRRSVLPVRLFRHASQETALARTRGGGAVFSAGNPRKEPSFDCSRLSANAVRRPASAACNAGPGSTRDGFSVCALVTHV